MFELNGVTKSFKKDFYSQRFKALDTVSFKVKSGAITGFLGANGAGKTTSLKIILGFIATDHGEVTYSSGDYQSFIKKLGYLPERPYFHAGLTGREFVAYMAALNDVAKSDVAIHTKKWSERLGIDHALDRRLSGYSKGMLQRIGFVSCLVHNPEFLILDEPVSGLDPIGRKMIKDVMSELHREGRSIFFSSHIVSDIEEISSNLIVLEKGSLVYDGSVAELLRRETSLSCEMIVEGVNPSDFSDYRSELLGNGCVKLIVDNDKKLSVIERVLKGNAQLVSLRDQSPSLEEIIYKTSGQQ